MPKRVLKFFSVLIFLMLFSVMTYTGYSIIRSIESRAQGGSGLSLVSYPGTNFAAGAQGGSAWSNISGDAFVSGKLGVQTSTQNSRFEVTLPDFTGTVRDNDAYSVVFGNGVPSGSSGHGGIRFGYNSAANYGVINVLKPTVAWGDLVIGDSPGSTKVGIGTIPSWNLDIQGGANSPAVARVHTTGTGAGYLLFGNSTAGVGEWMGDSSGNVALNHNGGAGAVFSSYRSGAVSNTLNLKGGNVGINTISPSVKLTVQGTHGDTQSVLHSLGGGTGATEADLFFWASEPGCSFTGVGIGNNVRNYTGVSTGGNICFPRISTARGGSYIRLLDGSIAFTTVATNGSIIDVMTLSSSGMSVTGAKNFDIPHPLDPENKRLVHSSLEGPEIGVYYRGEEQLKNGEVVIELPNYFEALTRKEGRTVLLTPVFEGDEAISNLAASVVKDGKFSVRAIDSSNPSQKFYWEVKAIRSDMDPLVVEKPDQK